MTSSHRAYALAALERAEAAAPARPEYPEEITNAFLGSISHWLGALHDLLDQPDEQVGGEQPQTESHAPATGWDDLRLAHEDADTIEQPRLYTPRHASPVIVPDFNDGPGAA